MWCRKLQVNTCFIMSFKNAGETSKKLFPKRSFCYNTSSIFGWQKKLTIVSKKKHFTKFMWSFWQYLTLLVIQFPRAVSTVKIKIHLNKFAELTISSENIEEGSAIKISCIILDGQTSLRDPIKTVEQPKTFISMSTTTANWSFIKNYFFGMYSFTNELWHIMT